MPDELIDVLTEDGRFLGRTKPKSQIHRDGDWHRTVHLWIVTSDLHVLLQKRAASKVNHPLLWDVSVAGHVDAGEAPETAAVREAREELGIVVSERELRQIATIRERWVIEARGYFDNELQEVYLVRREVDLRTLALQSGEVDDVALEPLAQFHERVANRDTTLVGHWEEYERIIDDLVERD